MKKILIFGAGKIGRSFIGQLFSQAGFEVVFIENDPLLVKLLNEKREYKVVIKSEKENIIQVIRNVRCIHTSQKKDILYEFLTTDLMATCVGQGNLPGVLQLLAEGISTRKKNTVGHLDIIIAENMRNAASYFRNHLTSGTGDPLWVDEYLGLIETSIGKMVPIMTEKDFQVDPLQVFAEPYNILILDKKGFKNPVPDVPGLAPKENMKAWVDRKSFIHNLGHAAAAYFGFIKNPEKIYLYEMLEGTGILSFTREVMIQSAEVLLREYPVEFTRNDLLLHIDDLLARFRNRSLKDTVYRVGMDLNRKLGPEDRLAGAIRLAVKNSSPFDRMAMALCCGFYFRGTDEYGKLYPSDEVFKQNFIQNGPGWVLQHICGFDRLQDHDILKNILNIHDQLIANIKEKL